MRGVYRPNIPLKSFVFRGLYLLIGFQRADTEKSGETIETIATPPKRGFLPAPIAALCNMPLSGPRGSLSSVFIPAGRLGTAPQERCFKLRSSNPFYSRSRSREVPESPVGP